MSFWRDGVGFQHPRALLDLTIPVLYVEITWVEMDADRNDIR